MFYFLDFTTFIYQFWWVACLKLQIYVYLTPVIKEISNWSCFSPNLPKWSNSAINNSPQHLPAQGLLLLISFLSSSHLTHGTQLAKSRPATVPRNWIMGEANLCLKIDTIANVNGIILVGTTVWSIRNILMILSDHRTIYMYFICNYW